MQSHSYCTPTCLHSWDRGVRSRHSEDKGGYSRPWLEGTRHLRHLQVRGSVCRACVYGNQCPTGDATAALDRKTLTVARSKMQWLAKAFRAPLRPHPKIGSQTWQRVTCVPIAAHTRFNRLARTGFSAATARSSARPNVSFLGGPKSPRKVQRRPVAYLKSLANFFFRAASNCPAHFQTSLDGPSGSMPCSQSSCQSRSTNFASSPR